MYKRGPRNYSKKDENFDLLLKQEQVHRMVNRLVIPHDWYETIMAYYLSNNGMADFERESYNLRADSGEIGHRFRLMSAG